MIKDEVGSVNGFGGETQERCLIGVGIQRGREARFEVQGVEVRMSGCSKENY